MIYEKLHRKKKNVLCLRIYLFVYFSVFLLFLFVCLFVCFLVIVLDFNQIVLKPNITTSYLFPES